MLSQRKTNSNARKAHILVYCKGNVDWDYNSTILTTERAYDRKYFILLYRTFCPNTSLVIHNAHELKGTRNNLKNTVTF